MAIDFIIDLDCIPKRSLTTQGILDRLKGQERARAIIRLFRDNGDDRPPSEALVRAWAARGERMRGERAKIERGGMRSERREAQARRLAARTKIRGTHQG